MPTVRCWRPRANKGIFRQPPDRGVEVVTRKTIGLSPPSFQLTSGIQGYHVQVTARSENDLSPDAIIRKVADASGSKYSGDSAPASSSAAAPPPPVASKPVFTATSVGGGSRGFNPLGSRTRAPAHTSAGEDDDGWGPDAPPVTRTQLEKVAPAYKPTKVNMNELISQKPEPSRFTQQSDNSTDRGDVVKGAYQPIGKVDIAAIRRQAQAEGSIKDDRPTIVKGSYEPVGKVDIAAIRARAQPAADVAPEPAQAVGDDEPKSLADRSSAFTQSERLTSLPKPKVANKFGGGSSSFTGTKAPTPVGFGSATVPAAAPVGAASKNFADQGGKTPAQIWAEKKARERGTSGAADTTRPNQPTSPVTSQTSGGWDGGYTGKKWAPVATTRTGQSGSLSQQATGEADATQEAAEEPAGGSVSAIRDRFKNAAPMGAAGDFGDEGNDAPAPPMSSRPNPVGGARGVPIPGLSRQQEEIPDEQYSRVPTPPAQPRSPTPPTPPAMTPDSPIRIAQPVGRGDEADIEPPEERLSQPSVPVQSLSQAVPSGRDLEAESQVHSDDPARGAGQAAAAATFGAAAAATAGSGAAGSGGKRALVQYDYEKAEDNELELKEGEYVTNIDMVDEDWWMGQNSKGESGLFPANYVELVEEETEPQTTASAAPAAAAAAAPAASNKPTAVAEYEYEAAEDNELSFPEGATITELVSSCQAWRDNCDEY